MSSKQEPDLQTGSGEIPGSATLVATNIGVNLEFTAENSDVLLKNRNLVCMGPDFSTFI